MIERSQLERSKAIQQRTGRTFHVATRLFPRRIRDATYVLYAFFRIADDVVDDPDPPSPEQQRAELERIRSAALGERPTDDPVLQAFQQIRDRYDIPEAEVRKFIESMERDISTDRYETHDELDAYLRGSSVAVGNMMLRLMDPEQPAAARPHASALAEAFQLTNFLRDVREDVLEYDRIYLPRSTLAEYGVTEAQIEQLTFTDEFAVAMQAELERAERRYHEGVDGIASLPDECQFSVLLAAILYADHHRLIRARGYDVLSARPSLGTRRRLALGLRTWWHWRRTGDPRATFDAVSALEDAGHDDRRSADRADDQRVGTDENGVETGVTVPHSEGRPQGPVAGFVTTLRTLLSPGNSK